MRLRFGPEISRPYWTAAAKREGATKTTLPWVNYNVGRTMRLTFGLPDFVWTYAHTTKAFLQHDILTHRMFARLCGSGQKYHIAQRRHFWSASRSQLKVVNRIAGEDFKLRVTKHDLLSSRPRSELLPSVLSLRSDPFLRAAPTVPRDHEGPERYSPPRRSLGPTRRGRAADIPVFRRTGNFNSLMDRINSLFGRVGNIAGTAWNPGAFRDGLAPNRPE